MRLAVIADIHSNIDALKAVVSDAQGWGASRFMAAGDVVGYGAEPNRCVSYIRGLDAVAVAGNHDWGVVEKTPISFFNSAARQAVEWTRERLNRRSWGYLSSLPLTLKQGDVSLAHANFIDPSTWDYVLDIYQAGRQFENFSTPLGVIGHSHAPFVVGVRPGERTAFQFDGGRHSWRRGERYLINAGSVGQPRDGDPRACYLRVDTEAGEFYLHRVEYDVGKAASRIRDAGLPSYLAQRLISGR